ncbi:MAG: PspC domain-containing protein [Chloroflexi bacterium]|nr:PspC domain-containing protein [Chloroflexota bacterium]
MVASTAGGYRRRLQRCGRFGRGCAAPVAFSGGDGKRRIAEEAPLATKRLYKSSEDRLLFGVCGGVAEYFEVDPVLVRLTFIALAFVSGVGLVLYVLLAIITPTAQTKAAQPAQVVGENLRSMPGETAEAGRRLGGAFRQAPAEGQAVSQTEGRTGTDRARNALALVLVVVGGLALAANLGAFWWFRWGIFWPLVLIALGAALVVGRRGRV